MGDLQCEISNLRNLKSAICNLKSQICNLRSALRVRPMLELASGSVLRSHSRGSSGGRTASTAPCGDLTHGATGVSPVHAGGDARLSIKLVQSPAQNPSVDFIARDS